MLPVYVSYFAGGSLRDKPTRAFVNACGFVIGFTAIFVVLGAFAGSVGRLLLVHGTAVNIVTGTIVLLFGLKYMGVVAWAHKKLKSSLLNPPTPAPNGAPPSSEGGLELPQLLDSSARKRLFAKFMPTANRPMGFASAIVFGVVFSVGWTPCVSAFLGSALMRASQRGSMLEGMLMLLVYSLGLGLPFIASAVLIHKLKGAFGFIQRHYKVINILAGGMLVLVGILMMTGQFARFTNFFL